MVRVSTSGMYECVRRTSSILKSQCSRNDDAS
jgi:hypothetical protein